MANQELSSASRQLLREVEEAVAPYRGRRLLVALSGGCDSVALLRGLIMAGADCEAANCNFHLRGAESDRDSQFCTNLCAALGIRLHTVSFDTAVYMQRHHLSLEMACRRLRHEWFDSLMSQYGFVRLATGHNATDNAETMLLNLLRGSGVRGLRGMPRDNGRVVRPLLLSPRPRIATFLRELGQTWVEDSSNAATDIKRNYLRNVVLPGLRTLWPGTDTSLARSLRVLSREDAILEHYIGKALRKPLERRLLTWEEIAAFPDGETLIYRFIEADGGTPHTADEIAALLPRPHSGRRWHLSSDSYAVTTPRGLALQSVADAVPGDEKYRWERVEITPGNTGEIWNSIRTSSNGEAWLPQPEECWHWRFLEPGDRIQPLGMKGSRLCSDVLAEAGVPLLHRAGFRVLCDAADRVIWMPGLKRSRLWLIDSGAHVAYRVIR